MLWAAQRGRQQEGGEASAGLPAPSPLSLLLYERLLEVVLVGDEEVEDGDGGLDGVGGGGVGGGDASGDSDGGGGRAAGGS